MADIQSVAADVRRGKKERKKERTNYSIKILEMWENAQHDGRPVEHRWRPLFNAAKFQTCILNLH